MPQPGRDGGVRLHWGEGAQQCVAAGTCEPPVPLHSPGGDSTCWPGQRCVWSVSVGSALAGGPQNAVWGVASSREGYELGPGLRSRLEPSQESILFLGTWTGVRNGRASAVSLHPGSFTGRWFLRGRKELGKTRKKLLADCPSQGCQVEELCVHCTLVS